MDDPEQEQPQESQTAQAEPAVDALPPKRPRVMVVLELFGLGAMLMVYLLFCLPMLDRSLWHDETITFMMYVQQPSLLAMLTDYSFPNNHLFHSLLLRMALVLGDSEPVIRLPALLGGLALLTIFYGWCRQRLSWSQTVVITILLAACTPVVAYAQTARGYSWLMAFSCLAIAAVDRYQLNGRRRWLGIAWAAVALATWTVPVGALLGVGLGAHQLRRWWLAHQAGSLDRTSFLKEASAPAAAGLFLLLAYGPIAGEVLAAGKEHGGSKLGGYLDGLAFCTQLPWWLAIASIGLGGWLWWRRDRDLAWLLFASLGVPLLLLLITGCPAKRVMLFLLPAIWMTFTAILRLPLDISGRKVVCGFLGLLVAGILWMSPGLSTYTNSPNGATVGGDGANWKSYLNGFELGRRPEITGYQVRLGSDPQSIYPSMSYYLKRTPHDEIIVPNDLLAKTLRNRSSTRLFGFHDRVIPDPWQDEAIDHHSVSELLPLLTTEFSYHALHLDDRLMPPKSLSLAEPHIITDNPNAVTTSHGDDGSLTLTCSEAKQRVILSLPLPDEHHHAKEADQFIYSFEVTWPEEQAMWLGHENYIRWGDPGDLAKVLKPGSGQVVTRITPGVVLQGGDGGSTTLQPQFVLQTGPSSAVFIGVGEWEQGKGMMVIDTVFGFPGDSITISHPRLR